MVFNVVTNLAGEQPSAVVIGLFLGCNLATPLNHLTLPRSTVDCGQLVCVQGPDCFGEDLIYFVFFKLFRAN